ncbi:hypothetical protein ABVK25_005283 [Lepraria finkii]|uniref:Uncharacterized protein n=1 Tax=Lepraria finkii TaxID=1340010 RepID=A0ABR4B9V9_9LECA
MGSLNLPYLPFFDGMVPFPPRPPPPNPSRGNGPPVLIPPTRKAGAQPPHILWHPHPPPLPSLPSRRHFPHPCPQGPPLVSPSVSSPVSCSVSHPTSFSASPPSVIIIVYTEYTFILF